MPAHVDHGLRRMEVERSTGVVREETQRAIEQRMQDLSDPEGRRRALIRDMAFCDLIVESTHEFLDKRGTLFTDEGAYLPVLRSLATFMNTKRLHADKLGLDPTERPVEDLEKHTKRLAEQEAAT